MAPAMATATRTEAAPVAAAPERKAAPSSSPRGRCPTPCCGCRRRPATPRWRGRWPPRRRAMQRCGAGCGCAACGPGARGGAVDEQLGAGLLRSAVARRSTLARGSVRSRAYAATSCPWKLPLPPSATPASPSSPTACWSTGWRSTMRRWSTSCAPASRPVTTRPAWSPTRWRSARACSTASRRARTSSSSRPSWRRPRARSQGEFADRSRAVAEVFDRKFDEAFGPDTGHVARALAKHFSDDSSVAVQNQVKAVLAEAARGSARTCASS